LLTITGEFTGGQLRMADMEWPEGKANPPQGTPDKFHIRVVTLHEPPFVVVTELDPETGQCPGTPCDWGFELICLRLEIHKIN